MPSYLKPFWRDEEYVMYMLGGKIVLSKVFQGAFWIFASI